MPFSRPSLNELIDRAASDIETGLPGTDARLRRSNLAVIARVHAGAVHGLYGYLDYLSRQLMVDLAETVWLERHAAIWDVTRLPADFAQGPVTFTGTDGTVIPARTPLQRSDAAAYETTADATVAAGVATAPVTALQPGASGNADTGTGLTMTLPIAGINGRVVVAAPGLSQGTDTESDDSLRARVLGRIRQAPNGGARADYIRWATEVPGVTRAWVYPLENGPGTVVVRFVRDDDTTFIPDSTEVAAVQAYIDVRRPVCAQVTVLAPVAAPLNMSITLTPNTAAVRAAVTAELADVLAREAQPGGTILLSHLNEAISVASGETNHVLTAPTADVVASAGQIATLGTITFA